MEISKKLFSDCFHKYYQKELAEFLIEDRESYMPIEMLGRYPGYCFNIDKIKDKRWIYGVTNADSILDFNLSEDGFDSYDATNLYNAIMLLGVRKFYISFCYQVVNKFIDPIIWECNKISKENIELIQFSGDPSFPKEKSIFFEYVLFFSDPPMRFLIIKPDMCDELYIAGEDFFIYEACKGEGWLIFD